MKKISLIAIFAFVTTFLFPPNVLAQAKPKTIVKLPVFTAGDVQTVEKPIEGDLMIAGKIVKVVSNVNGDAYVAGGDVEISGDINGNLIVVGGKVNISGKVLKNLIMAGGEVVVGDLATVDGYVLVGGKKIELLGNFLGPVKLGSESLLVGEKAVIGGNLEAYVSTSEISPDSKIVGEKNIKYYEVKRPEIHRNQWRQSVYFGRVVSFLSQLLILLILVKLFGQKIKQIDLRSTFWSNIGVGLVVLVVVPILILILAMTIVALPLSMIILVLYLVTLYLSTILTSILVGDYVSRETKLTSNNYISGFVGLLLVYIIRLTPFIGGFVGLIVFLLGIGIIFKGSKTYFFEK